MKIKLLCLFALGLAVFAAGCGSPEAVEEAAVTQAGIPEVLYALQNPDEWVILDVRSLPEFEGGPSEGVSGFGRIAGALHIEWSDALDTASQLLPEDQLREIYSEVLDGRSIIVYCRSGSRSQHTWEVLNGLGPTC